MMHRVSNLDISIIVIYLAICLIMGFMRMKNIKNIRDFTLGGNYISSSMLGTTLFATHIGAGSTVGEIEQIHALGLMYLISMFAFPLIWFTSGWLFSKNIDYFKKAGCISLGDIMELLYGKAGRWVTNISVQVMSFFVIAMQIVATGYLMHYFLGVSQSIGALIGFGVLVIYSALGGIKAIMFTDAFQGFVLFVCIPAACFAGYNDIGGYDELIKNLPLSHTSVDFTFDNNMLMMSFILIAVLPFTNGAFIQRFLMANNGEQVKKVCYSLMFVNIPLTIVIILIGYIVKIKAPDINSNTAFFYLIDNYLPAGLKGFVIIGILAAIMSTADSWVHTASVMFAHDTVKKLFPGMSDKQEVLVARVSLVGITLVAASLAFSKSSSIIGLEWLASSFWEPIMLVPIAAGFLKLKTNGKSYISSITCGALFTILGAYIAGLPTGETFKFSTISMAIGVTGSAIGLLSAHYYQAVYNKNFYKETLQIS